MTSRIEISLMKRLVLTFLALSVVGHNFSLFLEVQVSAAEGLPRRFQADRNRLSAAFDAFHKASELTKLPPGKALVPDSPQRTRNVLDQLERGLAAGDAVGDDFLNWLHPQMLRFFRTKFMAGQHSYYEGLRISDATLQLRGITLLQEWDREFWRSQAQSITAKAFQDDGSK